MFMCLLGLGSTRHCTYNVMYKRAGLLKRLLYSEATGADMFHNSHTTFNDQMVLGMVLGRAAGVGVYNSIRCRSIEESFGKSFAIVLRDAIAQVSFRFEKPST